MKPLSRILAITVTVLALAPVAVVAGTWGVPDDFSTIQAAIDSPLVLDGDTIRVSSGNHAGAYVSKSVNIVGEDGATIATGPLHGSGLVMGFRLLAGSDGASISHLRYTVDLAVMNGDGVDNVTISHSTFENTIQGVSNWRGDAWEISHNKFFDLRTRCGGGIAILTGDYTGGTVTGNLISHNQIMGTLHVATDDCGGYSGTGIVLYADFRWGRAGAAEITDNRVVKNKIGLVSDAPEVVDVLAIELTDTRDATADVILGNAIGFNDLRGTALQIGCVPASLDDVNDISRNLGENRGHGMHPAAFQAN